MKGKKVSISKNHYLIVGIAIVIIILGFFLYFEYTNENYSRSSECEIKNPDPDGYLLKICEYLQEHKDTIIPNKNPDEYSIKEFGEEEYQGKDILVIRLDCCYTGDLAYVDKETKEVIGFSPGDI